MRVYGETYNTSPRVTSTYSRTIYEELVKIADNVDFRHPRFLNRAKRNRSVGSAQALVVELALTDDHFKEKLRRFMIDGGRHWQPVTHYTDKY